MDKKKKPAPFNNPFQTLKLPDKPKAAEPAKTRTAAPPPSKKKAPSPDEDLSLFYEALDGVVPLSNRGTVSDPVVPLPPRVNDEAEALAELAEMVSGLSDFEFTGSEEYVEGHTRGLDPRVLKALRRGDYAHQGQLDLHGLTQAEARPQVEKFLTQAHREKRRCVLIIHGRGLNSKAQIPVLKEGLRDWLTQGRIGRLVLAFATARPQDGGAGAVYVLLRR